MTNPLTYQYRASEWIAASFDPAVLFSMVERNHRVYEESTELVQANGYTREQAHRMVDYVFDREPGKINQEIGGLMHCLAGLCTAHGLNMMTCAEDELARVLPLGEIIRRKRLTKPDFIRDVSCG